MLQEATEERRSRRHRGGAHSSWHEAVEHQVVSSGCGQVWFEYLRSNRRCICEITFANHWNTKGTTTSSLVPANQHRKRFNFRFNVLSSGANHDRCSVAISLRGRRELGPSSFKPTIRTHSLSARVELILVICHKISSTFQYVKGAKQTFKVHRTVRANIYMNWTRSGVKKNNTKTHGF